MVLREDNDAGEVIRALQALLSGEVPYDCALFDSFLVAVLSQDNELVVTYVIVEDLVVDEEFGEQSEVLAVELCVCAVD